MKSYFLIVVIMAGTFDIHGALALDRMPGGVREHRRAQSWSPSAGNILADTNNKRGDTPLAYQVVLKLDEEHSKQPRLTKGIDSDPAGKNKPRGDEPRDECCEQAARCAQGCCLVTITFAPLLIQLGLI